MARVLVVVVAVLFVIWLLVAQPSCSGSKPSAVRADTDRMRKTVATLCSDFCPRNWTRTSNLDRCAAYIGQQFAAAGGVIVTQEWKVGINTYRNVTAQFGGGTGALLVIGAHYDTFEATPGADDNASGIAGLIELAHLFGRNPPHAPVELVAYSLEEPPFFRTDKMGSAVHAKRLAASGREVRGVVVLEMIGRFDDGPRSQEYPALMLKLMYPPRGNYIAVVGRWDHGGLVKKMKTGMKGATVLPVYSIRAPALVPGVDFSDHMSYWSYGFPAVMVSDTGFYRNCDYHTDRDIPDKLDYDRMALVVAAVYAAAVAD